MATPPPPKDVEERRPPRLIEALLQDFNLIVLGGLAALAALTGSPLPLVVGGAAEALYLINAPGSSWFERYLAVQRARRRGVRRDAWRRQTLASLPRADREQFRAAQQRLAMATQSLDRETRILAQTELDRVEDLLNQMLDLLAVRVAATRYLATLDADALLREISRVRARLRAVTDDPELTRVEEQRLEVLQRRLDERNQMERNLQIVLSQISTLENGIGYLADKLVSWSASGREPQNLREILAGVENTEQAMEQVRPVVQQIQRVRQT